MNSPTTWAMYWPPSATAGYKTLITPDATTLLAIGADVNTAQDYYPFGMQMPGRSGYLEMISPDDYHKPFRYGFNGKENDNEVKQDANGNNIVGGQQDYGMRIYDPRIGKFLSVDPLSPKYPELTPYQFSGNSPIKFIDLDGLEPADPGKKAGEYEVAEKQGTKDYFGWTWTVQKKRGAWKQGSSTMYQAGDVANKKNGSSFDNNKKYFPNISVAAGGNPLFTNINSTSVNLADFHVNFDIGTSGEDSEKQGEAQQLVSKFVNGNPKYVLQFSASSGMANLLGKDPAFLTLAHTFENNALSYFAVKGTLEGFNGSQILNNNGRFPYIKDHLFMYTVMGGTQQWNAQIQKISAGQIKVSYTVWDHFGAGTDDAYSWLPGLPALYWLQHNSAHFDPATSKLFNPFIWNINVNRPNK